MGNLNEVCCWGCSGHICWMNDCGPTGMHYCDSCAERKEREDDEDEDEDEDDDDEDE